MQYNIFLNTKRLLHGAQYVAHLLSKSRLKKRPQDAPHLKQTAIYLMQDDTVKYSSEFEKKLDFMTGLPLDKTTVKKIKKILYRPHNGILFCLLEAALSKVLFDFYTTLLPHAQTTQRFKNLETKDMEAIQLMFLFSELKQSDFAYPATFNEYFRYCTTQNKVEDKNKFQDRVMFLKEVNQHAKNSLFLYDKPFLDSFSPFLKEIFESNSALSLTQKLIATTRYFSYLGNLLHALGLHKKSFINDEGSETILKLESNFEWQDLKTLCNTKEALYDENIFHFCQYKLPQASILSPRDFESEILLAFSAICNVPLPEFKDLPETFSTQQEDKNFTIVDFPAFRP